MQKEKTYVWTKFSPEVILKAVEKLEESKKKKKKGEDDLFRILKISFDKEEWTYDDEDEFFANYRLEFATATYHYHETGRKLSIHVYAGKYREPHSDVSIELPKRSQIESVFAIFEGALESCSIPKPPEPPWESKVRAFIGHGRSPQWRDLKDHLSEKHGFKVEAYEIGAQGGLTMKEVLEEMLTSSSIALLVMTGEDEDAKGELHARENVIHETGLFQGRLGFRRAIVLFEEGTTEFSNIHGIQQIRFAKDSIRETFGEVLATIRREFAPGDE